MSERWPRAWRFYIDDMMRFARNVLDYVDGIDQPERVGASRACAELRPLDTA